MHKRTFSAQSLSNLLQEEHNSNPLANLSVNIPSSGLSSSNINTIRPTTPSATSSSIIQSPVYQTTNSNFSSGDSINQLEMLSDLEKGQANTINGNKSP